MGIKEIQKLKCQDEFLTVSKVYRTANLAHLATFFELSLKIYQSSFLIFEIPSSSMHENLWICKNFVIHHKDIAQTYLQTQYGNGVLGNVYLSADYTKR